MAAINAAWALIGEPAARAAYDRARARCRGRAPPARRPNAADAASRRPDRRRASRGTPPAARDRLARLDLRAIDAGRRVRRVDARRRRARRGRAAARSTRRGASSTSVATTAGRSARSRAATSSTSSGSTGCRSAGRIARRSTRSCAPPVAGARQDGDRPTGAGCSAAADRRFRQVPSVQVARCIRETIATWPVRRTPD